jgi:hypothetical protein
MGSKRAVQRFSNQTVPWAMPPNPNHHAAIHQPDGRGKVRVATQTAIAPTTAGKRRSDVPTSKANLGLASQRSPATTV